MLDAMRASLLLVSLLAASCVIEKSDAPEVDDAAVLWARCRHDWRFVADEAGGFYVVRLHCRR